MRSGVCFQQYLDWFSQAYPKQLHLIQRRLGRWHIWSELDVPDNVILFFQPPYTPQVNPIEEDCGANLVRPFKSPSIVERN